MQETNKITLSTNNLFWGCAWYRSKLFKSGVELTDYVRPDGTTIKSELHDKYKKCQCCNYKVCLYGKKKV